MARVERESSEILDEPSLKKGPDSMKWTPPRKHLAMGLALALVVSGCANPADDSTAAQVSDAQPAPAAASAPAEALVTTEAVAVAPSETKGLPIAADASKIAFIGSKVTGSHHGGFPSFTGSVALKADGMEVESIQAEIDLNAMTTDNEKLTAHLKSPDFFDTAKHPKATFTSTAIQPGGEKGATHTVTGNFHLHGVTKSIQFPATIKVDDKQASIDSDFFINRKDFGIAYAGKSDDLIRDEVVIKMAIKALK